MPIQIGSDNILARNNGGTWASPTWATIAEVENLNVARNRAKATVNTRASKHKKILVGQKETIITFRMPRNCTDTDFVALQTAFEAGSNIIFAYATGAIATSGTRYVKLECKVSKFGEDEPIDDAAWIDVELEPAADSTNDPVETTTP